jgi:nucleoside-diphosphate-sugar epimerase
MRIYTSPDGAKLIFVEADIRDFLGPPEAFSALYSDGYPIPTVFDDVYHFAAIVGGRMKIEGDPMAVAQDLAMDAEFFAWAVKAKPGRIMYPSSSAAYPIDIQTREHAIAVSEDQISFAGQLGQPDMTYGWSKLTGEYLAQIAAQDYGLNVACVRPFSGYGEDQELSYPIPAIAARAAAHEDPLIVWGTGKQGRDFVHIDDCIDAILLAMEKISDGTAVNIASGKLTTFLEVAALFAELAGYKPEIKPLVDKPMGVHSRYADISKIQDVLGWSPKISLEQGFGRVLAEASRRINP